VEKHGDTPGETTADRHQAAGDRPYRVPSLPQELAALQEQFANLQAAVDSMDSNLCLLDETGRILWVNAAWRRFARENGGDPSTCSEGGDYFVWRHDAATNHDAPGCGEEPARTEAFVAGLRDVLCGRRELFETDYPCDTPNGARWFHARARGHVQNGSRRTIVSHEDITQRKEAEAERAAMLRHRLELQKIEAIASLAGGIAHDFNNILTAIVGNLDLARMQAPPGTPVRELLDEIGKASERARGLVRQILSFRVDRPDERQLLPLAPLIEEAAGMLRAAGSRSLSIDLRLAPLPPLPIDPTQIHQVLLNLFTNAAHAMEGRQGRLRVELDAVAVDTHAAARLPGCNPGRHARIRVIDNGVGIAAALLTRIFDPYFTTKPAGKGTGIGLPVARAIVHNHGGAITVHSELGTGTTFEVYLPMPAERS
jgi:signal transduction histidine kinase